MKLHKFTKSRRRQNSPILSEREKIFYLFSARNENKIVSRVFPFHINSVNVVRHISRIASLVLAHCAIRRSRVSKLFVIPADTRLAHFLRTYIYENISYEANIRVSISRGKNLFRHSATFFALSLSCN